MSTGTVKWFNPTKGYGFIQPQGGGQDVFVHISAVERAGMSTLNEGQQVEFEVVSVAYRAGRIRRPLLRKSMAATLRTCSVPVLRIVSVFS